MSGQTEEKRFKKTTQVVNGGDNNATVGNSNDEFIKNFDGVEQNRTQEPRSANSARERDLDEKGYTQRPTDEALDEVKDLNDKLSKRGNTGEIRENKV